MNGIMNKRDPIIPLPPPKFELTSVQMRNLLQVNNDSRVQKLVVERDSKRPLREGTMAGEHVQFAMDLEATR